MPIPVLSLSLVNDDCLDVVCNQYVFSLKGDVKNELVFEQNLLRNMITYDLQIPVCTDKVVTDLMLWWQSCGH